MEAASKDEAERLGDEMARNAESLEDLEDSVPNIQIKHDELVFQHYQGITEAALML